MVCAVGALWEGWGTLGCVGAGYGGYAQVEVLGVCGEGSVGTGAGAGAA